LPVNRLPCLPFALNRQTPARRNQPSQRRFSQYPDDKDNLLALVALNRESGDLSAALEYAERWRSYFRTIERSLTLSRACEASYKGWTLNNV
jgi:hypothetical protein